MDFKDFLFSSGLINLFKNTVLSNLQTTDPKPEVVKPPEDDKYIICNGKNIKIEWDKVVTFNDEGGMKASPHTYYSIDNRAPDGFIVHWDGCASSKETFKVLDEERHLSVHFGIDNDGTIYQFVDCQFVAQHASKDNKRTVGVEVCDKVHMSSQHIYKEPRPVWDKAIVHGNNEGPILGFYPVQIDALKALLKCVCTHYNINFEVPCNPDGTLNTNFVGSIGTPGTAPFKGIQCHYHIDKGKIDCAGLDLVKIVKEIKN